MARSGRCAARRERLAPVGLVVGALGLSCASAGPRPQTGDLSFRLTWSGRADVDLYVVSPLDERIDFLRPRSTSGGRLDVDCNYGDNDCRAPMENIFWPRGSAAAGDYRYWAVVADRAAVVAEDRYLLEVRYGLRVVRSHAGRLADLEDRPLVRSVAWPPPQ